MKKLQEHFIGIGYKRLSQVEINPNVSNQHELNGVTIFKELFGLAKKTFKSRFIYLPDFQNLVWEDNGICTWYDAREHHPTRTEYRLFYSNPSIFQRAKENDLLFVLLRNPEELWLVITPKDSTSEQQLCWLFELENQERKIAVKSKISDKEEVFAKNYILEILGIEVSEPNEEYLEDMLHKFDGYFPSTSIFSEYARSTLDIIPVIDDPDEALLLSFDREELLFKIFERYLVIERMKKGFGDDGLDVDQFITFSLSVHNRRKSRAGYSLENHLEFVFNCHEILYTRGAITERRSKPDFLFPGIDYYKNEQFNAAYLKMLGSKTTAKDRWRQVLPEADRIENKHLITLEPSISLTQTNEMKSHNVTLVVPSKIKSTYTKEQQNEILTFSGFLNMLKENEKQIRITT